ncbi:hypothetical protein Taro_023066 [Colocasia esculenta]|uniref:Uncharacterized protein n=1 Tax=Colocasia esculenta TaxID=4460 RepID=A0A843V375_COLES|nr:hypothetical protein [Colocasia esculenta]
MEEDGSFSIGRHRDNGEKDKHGSKSERGTLSSVSNEEEEREPGGNVSAGLQIEVGKKQIYVENIATSKRRAESREHPVKAETYDNHDPSDSDSGRAESSPDASMADITPMIDDLHPILGSEDPQSVNAFMDDLHSLSGASTGDDGSGEEAESQGEEGEEEEEEAKEELEDGAALAVKWTEDDAKNLLVLGTSELERNQRLENLIAKRRTRKNLSVDMNLIDLDVHESLHVVDELSRVQMTIPPISTTKQNPFDLLYDSDPIPGSAPSVLLPRRNPFDLPLNLANESSGLTGLSHQSFVAVRPQRDTFSSRHEFALGESFSEFKQERNNVKLRPYFVTERADVESSYAHLERELSEKSDSKVISVLESESISSAVDQDHGYELSEQQWHQEGEIERIPTSVSDSKQIERQSNSDDEVDSVDPLCRHNDVNIHSSHVTVPTTSVVLGASIHDSIKHEEQDRHDLDLWSPTSEAEKSDMAEEKYSGSSSSCSSETSMENIGTKSEGSTDHQIPSGHSAKSVSVEVEILNDPHVVEPVYDSSPSAAAKSASNIPSIEEEFLHGDKGRLKSISSLSSETLIEASGIVSPSIIAERNIVSASVSGCGSMGNMRAFHNGELWVAPPNLFFVDKNESRSREVEVIREQDVIQVEFAELSDEYDHPTASSAAQSVGYSASTGSHSSEDTATDMGEDLQFSEQESAVEAPDADVPGTSTFNSQVLANAEAPPVGGSAI